MNNRTPQIQLLHRSNDMGELTRATRFQQALTEGSSRYPIHRWFRFAAEIELEVLFDAIALSGHWAAYRPRYSNILLDGADVFISGSGNSKLDYCSVSFSVWAASPAAAEVAREQLIAIAGSARITAPMFSIDWHFLSSCGNLESVTIEERADGALEPLAYPTLEGGVDRFIARYLAADESVLVLQGPPGTGKTRLIRAILGALSQLRGRDAQALYTGDKKALEGDELFVRFITGGEDAFIVEDADHVLAPRAAGNEHLHRFLTIADGVVRSQGRKIIFSTNLPNVGDLDEALVRPGRCFALAEIRALTPGEADALLEVVAPLPASRAEARARLAASGQEAHTLAEVYGALRAAPARAAAVPRRRMCMTA